MDDNSLMPFGKYRHEKLANVSASYLIHCYNQGWLKGDLKQYVLDNWQDLCMESQREKQTYFP